MWRRSVLYLAMLVSGACLTATRLIGPCPDPATIKNCPCGQMDGFTIVKAFPVQLSDKLTEYTYVFTTDADYQITTCGPDGQNVPLKVAVLDPYRNPLFDNFDKRAKQYRQRMGYVCGQTAVAHLKLEPAQGGKGCAYVFVAFRAQ